ncbi:unnamed protein product [Clonostachys chloroleuca]|uniref:Uncharacterized protein n=1 Tax=Clonostachys chloroleuca TaxID=1926264 RepID=A0AA35LUU1_9HYPO|nr:unnamed protein product [Clonostachys chloroleuca]
MSIGPSISRYKKIPQPFRISRGGRQRKLGKSEGDGLESIIQMVSGYRVCSGSPSFEIVSATVLVETVVCPLYHETDDCSATVAQVVGQSHPLGRKDVVFRRGENYVVAEIRRDSRIKPVVAVRHVAFIEEAGDAYRQRYRKFPLRGPLPCRVDIRVGDGIEDDWHPDVEPMVCPTQRRSSHQGQGCARGEARNGNTIQIKKVWPGGHPSQHILGIVDSGWKWIFRRLSVVGINHPYAKVIRRFSAPDMVEAESSNNESTPMPVDHAWPLR